MVTPPQMVSLTLVGRLKRHHRPQDQAAATASSVHRVVYRGVSMARRVWWTRSASRPGVAAAVPRRTASRPNRRHASSITAAARPRPSGRGGSAASNSPSCRDDARDRSNSITPVPVLVAGDEHPLDRPQRGRNARRRVGGRRRERNGRRVGVLRPLRAKAVGIDERLQATRHQPFPPQLGGRHRGDGRRRLVHVLTPRGGRRERAGRARLLATRRLRVERQARLPEQFQHRPLQRHRAAGAGGRRRHLRQAPGCSHALGSEPTRPRPLNAPNVRGRQPLKDPLPVGFRRDGEAAARLDRMLLRLTVGRLGERLGRPEPDAARHARSPPRVAA